MMAATAGPYRLHSHIARLVVDSTFDPDGAHTAVAMAFTDADAEQVVHALNLLHTVKFAEGGEVEALAEALRRHGFVDLDDDTVPTWPDGRDTTPVWVLVETLARFLLAWQAARAKPGVS